MSLDPFQVTQSPTVGDFSQLAGTTVDGAFKADPINLSTDSSSFLGDSFKDLNSSLGTIGKVTGGLSSLAQIGLGFKALGLAEDELDIKKDQWAMAKGELKHMQNTRKRLTASYMGGSASNSGTPASKLA